MRLKRFGLYVWSILLLRRFSSLSFLGSWRSTNHGLLYDPNLLLYIPVYLIDTMNLSNSVCLQYQTYMDAFRKLESFENIPGHDFFSLLGDHNFMSVQIFDDECMIAEEGCGSASIFGEKPAYVY